MKYKIKKNQTVSIGVGIFNYILCGLVLFCCVGQLRAQDWQPGIDYSDVDDSDYGNSYNAAMPLPDEPVRLTNRIASQEGYSTRTKSAPIEIRNPPMYRVNNGNRVVHATYNNQQSQNKIIQQNYENEITPQKLPITPQRLTVKKTSTAAVTAAAKPRALPKHISRDFDTNFNIDNALTDFDNLPADNDSIVVRKPLQGTTLQVSGTSDCNNCEIDEFADNSQAFCADGYNSCGEVVYDGGFCSPMMTKPFGSGILDNLTIFGGITGFKAGQLDATRGGNFGFTEGVNWSAPVSVQYCTLSTQLGFRAIHSNVNGNFAHTIGIAEKDRRTQYFFTAGLFKRDLTSPIQAGVAFDHFEDNLYGKLNLTQLRFELSVRTFSNLEYGFIGNFGLEDGSSSHIDIRENLLRYGTLVNNYRYKIESQNYYTLFARKHFAAGNTGEFRIGATEYGHVLMSANGEFPINDRVALNGAFTTMIPNGSGGWNRETWDLSVGLVIYFRGGAMTKTCNENRPMFDVAQNGSFLTRIMRK
ncbi:MAG: hypothetical protein LBJ00_10315 [Planctomycetaceae bacterium]|jgi:hypothetical protein|nr:hypothetical protein [Planctomycetaceae bacterium]